MVDQLGITQQQTKSTGKAEKGNKPPPLTISKEWRFHNNSDDATMKNENGTW